jgi:hypothetical protein
LIAAVDHAVGDVIGYKRATSRRLAAKSSIEGAWLNIHE